MVLVRYLARRTARGLLALLVFLFVAYLVIGTLIPNDANTLFPVMTQEELDAYRARLGLQRPLVVQFGIWLRGVVVGDLGRRTFGAPVATSLGDSLVRSTFVLVIGLSTAYVFGWWLGRRTGWRSRPSSHATTVVAVVLGTAFPPFMAFLLTFWLREQTSILRDLRTGLVGDVQRVWLDVPVTRTQVLVAMTATVVAAAIVVGIVAVPVARRRGRRLSPGAGWALASGLAIGGWWLATDLETQALDLAVTAVVPILAFTILSFGEFMVVGQGAMAPSLNEDFVMVARAKGLPERRVRDVHGASSARLVMMSRLAISLPYLLTGLVIIEQAVAWPGLGDFLFQALQGRDLPTVMSGLLVIGVFTVVTRVMLDVMQVVLDPRVRRNRHGGP